MSKAIYAFSGDPITFGHIDIIERASKIFGHIICAIGANPGKKYLFELDERVTLAKDALKKIPNVSVTAFTGLLADFAYENDVHVIIRGLRNAEDFNFESLLHQLNESQVHGMETFLMPCRQQLMHVSSSAAKALQLEQGLIHEFVPLNVKQKLEERISGQLVIGVTGEIGTGKSHLINGLLAEAEKQNIKAQTVDVDKLGHEILERLIEPVYKSFRTTLINQFGHEIKGNDDFIDSKKLGEIIFANENLLQHFNQLIYPLLLLRLRKELYHKQGLILLESSLLTEFNALSYCNNHVIVTNCSHETQIQRLKARGYSEEKIQQRLIAQYSFEKKINLIKSQIAKNRFGEIIIADGVSDDATKILTGISKFFPTPVISG